MTFQGLRVLIAEDETLIRLDLRQMLEEHGIEVCGESLLSMSVGEAYYPDHGTNGEQLLAEADRHMYHAKKQHKLEAELTPVMSGQLEMLSAAVQ